MKIFLLYCLCLLCLTAQAQTPDLSKGEWLKIGITQTGVHKVTGKELAAFRKNLMANSLRLVGTTATPLPQRNADSPLTSLQEIPIQVVDDGGNFSGNDAIYFYAESPKAKFTYKAERNKFEVERNTYADTIYYYLQLDATTPSKRLVSKPAVNPQGQPQTTTPAYYFYEQDEQNLLQSGRAWMGEFIPSKRTFPLPLTGRIDTAAITLTSVVVGTVLSPQKLAISINQSKIGGHAFQPTGFDAYHPYNRYNQRGQLDTLQLRHQPNVATNNLELTYTFAQPLGFPNGAFLDYFAIQYLQNLQLTSSQLSIYPNTSVVGQTASIQFPSRVADVGVWDVTSALQPVALNFANSTTTLLGFQRQPNQQLVAFTPNLTHSVASLKKLAATPPIAFQTTPNLLIITPSELMPAAQRLAKLRKSQDIDTQIVTTQQIFANYTGGIPDPTALRNVIRAFWQQDSSVFKYVLLLGDATFDYRNRSKFGTAEWQLNVPTYESRESLEPIYSYASDDYFGFLEPHEGDWEEGKRLDGYWDDASAVNHTLDIGIGRLPVRNLTQAQQVVDKLIQYDSPASKGNWRQQITLVADDEDYNLHLTDAEQLANLVNQQLPWATTEKIYVANYQQVITPNGERSPAANKALTQAVEDGSLLVNYIGHGSEDGWSDEKLLTLTELLSWRNLTNLPVFLTATCQFGRYDNPNRVSGAELALLNPKGGAAALLTTTRPVYSSSNTLITNAFYKNIKPPFRLGDIFKNTKNNAFSGVLNRNFSLLGDPSMALAVPLGKAVLDSIDKIAAKPVVLQAAQLHELSGSINDPAFNGKIYLLVRGEGVKNVTTPTTTTSAYTFRSKGPVLYRTETAVRNGKFVVRLRLPNQIASGNGTIELYAIAANGLTDAAGNLPISLKSGTASVTDNVPPEISIQYQNNGYIAATVTDNWGLSIAENASSSLWTITLNDTLQITINELVILSDESKKATLSYALPSLSAGQHTIQLKVWDAYNNSSSKALTFTVAPTTWQVEQVLVSPSPASELVQLLLKHNGKPSDFKLTFTLIDLSGKPIYQATSTCYYCAEQLSWEFMLPPEKIQNGLYIYQLTVADEASKQQLHHAARILVWK